MKLENLQKLFVHELKDLYSAENQLTEALPTMINAATDKDLRSAFTDHLAETKEHVARLETIFKSLDYAPGGHRCKGMAGLIEETKSALTDVPEADDEVRDALLIAGAQRVEHYEMAGYGIARAYAEQLGNRKAADLLTRSIEEEGRADRTLSHLAERRINFEAMSMS